MAGSGQSLKFVRQLEGQGFTVTRTRGGHWQIIHPKMRGPVFAAFSPSDHRSLKNTLAIVRRKMRQGEVLNA